MLTELTESVKARLRSAARKLTGYRRRQFQAEMAVKYCGGIRVGPNASSGGDVRRLNWD